MRSGPFPPGEVSRGRGGAGRGGAARGSSRGTPTRSGSQAAVLLLLASGRRRRRLRRRLKRRRRREQALPSGSSSAVRGRSHRCRRVGRARSGAAAPRVALCVPECTSKSRESGEAEPRALGGFGREDSFPRLQAAEP